MNYENNPPYNSENSVQSPPSQNYYQQPYYNEFNYGAYPPPNRTNPLGIVSMILGIVSLVVAIVTSCCTLGFNMPFAIAAIVTGIFQIKSKTNQNGRGMGIAGIICGSLSIAIFLIILLFFLVIFIISLLSDTSTSNHTYY